MPLDPSGIGEIAQGAGEVLSLGKGIYDMFHFGRQAKNDEAELAKLRRPFMKVQDEFYQNRNLAEVQAQQGTPQSTRDFVTQQNQTGLSTALDYLKQAGGSPNDIAKLFGTYANSINTEGAQDAEMHTKNIDYFTGQNSALADEKTKAFAVNELQPYEDKVAQLTEKIKTDKLNQNSGFNTAVSSLTAAGSSLQNFGLGKGKGNSTKSIVSDSLFNNSAPYSIDNRQPQFTA